MKWAKNIPATMPDKCPTKEELGTNIWMINNSAQMAIFFGTKNNPKFPLLSSAKTFNANMIPENPIVHCFRYDMLFRYEAIKTQIPT